MSVYKYTKGLSPRVRGNRPLSLSRKQRLGSIPACAGEPVYFFFRVLEVGVYPRVCGGTRGRREPVPADKGLSPRVRGNPAPRSSARKNSRSIPACAGEPAPKERKVGMATVYPRVCGGTGISVGIILNIGGLSPRVRGNPIYPSDSGSQERSIPACAGEPRRCR